jgi:hypothetical protein
VEVYLWLIEVVTLKLLVARFEKAVEYDSLNVKLPEVDNRFVNAQVVSRRSERRLN